MRRLTLLLAAALVLLGEQPPLVRAAAAARCPGSPNQCSLHGSCVLNRQGEPVCNCQWGYDASDCSKSAFSPDMCLYTLSGLDQWLTDVSLAVVHCRDVPARI